MKNAILLLISTCCIIVGCSDSIYAPINKGTHTVSEQGQLFVSGSASYGQDINIGFNGFANYSPKPGVGIQVHYNRQFVWRNFGIAAGLYKSRYRNAFAGSKKGYHFDAYVNYTHNIIHFQNARDIVAADIYYHDLSIPIGFHIQNEIIGFDIILRPHVFDVYMAKITKNISDKKQPIFYDYLSKPFISADLIGRMNMGRDHFKVFCTIGISYADETRLYFIDSYLVSAGFNLNIGKYLKL